MAAPAKPTSSSSSSRRGLGARMTAKVGPLPVWAWALLILVAGYLAYKFTAGKSSSSSSTTSTDTSSTDTTGSVTGDTGSPPASGQGSVADNLSSDALTQLSGLSGQVDALTGLIQSTPAFDPNGGGDSGSGSTAPNDGSPPPAAPPAKVPTKAPAKPAPHPPAPAQVRYYTYAPGKAPKGQAKNQAPGKGPAGTTLHFAKGKGYYYA